MKIKLCGVKRPEDIRYMNEFRPDYVGFVFAGAKRRISPEAAAELAAELEPGIGKVGVFVNEPPEAVAYAVMLAGLDAVQLHGSEGAESIAEIRRLLPGTEIWKAARVKSPEDVTAAMELSADRFLLDSFSPGAAGGTGKPADLGAIEAAAPKRPYFLAGGLDCENIAAIVRRMCPFGVDISSGVETDGVKDREKIETIMRILRETEGSGKAGN